MGWPQLNKVTLFLWVVILVIVLAGMLPLIYMFAKSVYINGELTFRLFTSILHTKKEWTLLLNSLRLAALVSIFATFIGVFLGLLLGKTDLPFKHLFALLFTAPLLMPPYIMAVAWSDLLSPYGGLLSFIPYHLQQTMVDLLFSFSGAVMVLTIIYTSVPMLLTMAFLNTIDPKLEQAARLMASWRIVLKEITLPLIAHGICFSFLLVFILVLGEFSVPSFLHVPVFSVESFTQFSASYDFESATAQAMPLTLIVLLLLLFESFFLHQNTYSITPFASDKICTIKLGRKTAPFLMGLLIMLFIFVCLPFLGLAATSKGFKTYLLTFSYAGDSLIRSLIYAFEGATLLTVLGFFMGYIIHKKALKAWKLADQICFFLFAIPGTVLGIGLIKLWNRPVTSFVYSSFLIIIIGYIARYIALPTRIMAAQFLQIPPSQEEAAQVLGISWLKRIIFILAPLSKPGIAAAWLVSFLFCLRDTDVTMLLYPPGSDTLPVRIFTMMANGSPEIISALCMIMVFLALLFASILMLIWRKTGG